MKRISILFLLGLTLHSVSRANPDISLDINRFRNGNEMYIELSLYAVGASLICDPSSMRYGLDYVVLIKDTLNQVLQASKYQVSRSGCPATDIFDVKRFQLLAGLYDIEVMAYDLADTLSQLSVTQRVELEKEKANFWISDVQLLASMQRDPEGTSPMHKQGIYMEPLPFHLYYPALKTLHLYLEVYDTDQLEGQPYLQYTLRPAVGDVPPPIVTYKKVNKGKVMPGVFQLDIGGLITGYYQVESALYDGNKNLVQTRYQYFSRMNPTGDSLFLESDVSSAGFGFADLIPEDSLEYSLKAMAPIATSLDVEVINNLVRKGSAKARRHFIHKFWTNQSGKYAGPAFEKYMQVARVVDVTYQSGFGYGFESDRGHIFLKYGQPNDVLTVEDEPSAPPYEIWYYHNFPATHQTNVKFLFYNPSLTQNGFELLHSNANGEVKNPRWEVELYRDATLETPGVNETQMGDNVHRNARTYFDN